MKFYCCLWLLTLWCRIANPRHSCQLKQVLRVYYNMQEVDPNASKKFLIETVRSIYATKRYQKNFARRPVTSNSAYNSVFLLGSGPSINEITDGQWRHIRNHVSWAFNFFLVHAHIPTRFYLQAPHKRDDVDALLAALLSKRREAYQDVKVAARGDAVNRRLFHQTQVGQALATLGSEVTFVAEAFIPSTAKIPPSYLVRQMAEAGFFDASRELPVPKFASTICLLVADAIRQGYKKIVLCGIDMNDRGHFYDDPAYLKQYPEMALIKNIIGTGAHPHVASSIRLYSVKDYLLALREYARASGAEIYVTSKSSSLYPEFGLYDFGM